MKNYSLEHFFRQNRNTVDPDQLAWSVVLTGFEKNNYPSRSLATYNKDLFEHSIRFLPLESNTKEASFFILDPSNSVRAILYPTKAEPIEPQDLINVINALKHKDNFDKSEGTEIIPENIVIPEIAETNMSRTEIHYLDNQPLNVNCPSLNRVVGEYVLGDPSNVDVILLNFAIYAFALIKPNGEFEVYSKKHLQQLADLRFANPNLKVLLAIGGWAAEGFSDAALTPTSRFDFAREVQKWVKEYNLDGIDLDWEYPGSSVSGIKSRPQDTENFTLLLDALRQVLGPNKLITVAGTGSKSYISKVQIKEIAKFIDYFNIMSYDFNAGETGISANNHQSNLFESDLGLRGISTDVYVNNLIDAGMPSEKLLIGVPFYGRRGATNTKTYDEIRGFYLNKNGYAVKWDDEAKAPYIIDSNGSFAFSFDNELSIYFKGQYVFDKCLGGMFSWQSNFDNANLLSSAMHTAINDPRQLESILKSYYA